jgi:peptide/nickel transport system substrate-binding protein
MRKRSSVLFASLVAVGLVAAACGGDDSSSKTASTTAAAPGAVTSATPGAPTTKAPVTYDPEATLRIGQPSRPVALDPHKGASPTIDYTYMGPVYDRLVELNGDTSIGPMLAESWQEAADGKSTTFKLRKDVKFHDGTPFNADAVLANINRILSGEVTLAQRNLKGNAKVASIEKVDDSTVKFNTTDKSTLLPYWLAVSMEAGGMVSPAALANPTTIAALATTPSGSGPFKVKEVRQDRVLYDRVDGYWDKEVAASAPKRIEMIGFGDEQAGINALLSGQIDVVSVQAPIPNFADWVKKNDLNSYSNPATARATGIYVNIKTPGLDNPKVRKALSLAIDRKAFAEIVGPDFCTPTVQPFGKGYPGYDPSLDAAATKFDPQEAKRLLAEAGVKDLSFNAMTPETALYKTTSQLVQSNWKDVGVNISVTVIPTQQTSAEWQAGKWPFYASSLTGNVEPMIYLSDNNFTRGSPGGAPPELTALAAKAEPLPLRSPERNKAFQDISRYLVDNPMHMILCIFPKVVVSQKNIAGIERDAMLSLTHPIDSRHLGVIKK